MCKIFEKSHEKTLEHNHVLAPIVGKDLGQKLILGILIAPLVSGSPNQTLVEPHFLQLCVQLSALEHILLNDTML